MFQEGEHLRQLSKPLLKGRVTEEGSHICLDDMMIEVLRPSIVDADN